MLPDVAGRDREIGEHDDDRTLFKSLGLAVEDVAAARFIHERALADGSGTWVMIGGLRPE